MLGLLLLATTFLLLPVGGAEASDGPDWWSDLDRGEASELTDVRMRPGNYQGREKRVTFPCIFRGTSTVYPRYRSTIDQRRHQNFSVWPDGHALWEDEPARDLFPFMYISRTNIHLPALFKLEKFTRIEVTARVAHIFTNQPMIEVISFYVTNQRLGDDVVTNMMWGDNEARKTSMEAVDSAASYYRKALVPDLAPRYRIKVEKRLVQALRRAGRAKEAEAVLQGRALAKGGTDMPDPDGMGPGNDPTLPPDPFDEGPPTGAPPPRATDGGFGAPELPSDIDGPVRRKPWSGENLPGGAPIPTNDQGPQRLPGSGDSEAPLPVAPGPQAPARGSLPGSPAPRGNLPGAPGPVRRGSLPGAPAEPEPEAPAKAPPAADDAPVLPPLGPPGGPPPWRKKQDEPAPGTPTPAPTPPTPTPGAATPVPTPAPGATPPTPAPVAEEDLPPLPKKGGPAPKRRPRLAGVK